MIIRDIPGDYTVDAPRPGRITKIEYDNGREKKYEDAFDMSETGNTALYIKEGGVHEMKYVKEYLFNVLPLLFPDK